MNDALKAALWTALFTFVAVFGISLLGWVSDVAAWASSNTTTSTDFPSITPLAKAAVAAVAAGVTGLVNWVVRFAQSKGALPGNGPSYPGTPQ